MSKHTLSREGIIPFYDAKWNIMQMKNISFTVTCEQEEWEDYEVVAKNLDEAFNKQYEIAMLKSTTIAKKIKQAGLLLSLVKPHLTQGTLDEIIKQVKAV